MQLRREKVELENALEQEQESLVNRLWRKMEKLEAEKRYVHSSGLILPESCRTVGVVYHDIICFF